MADDRVDYEAAHRARTEQSALNLLVERLSAQFPELPPETIAATVRGEYDARPTRLAHDFTSTQIERAARTDLAVADYYRRA